MLDVEKYKQLKAAANAGLRLAFVRVLGAEGEDIYQSLRERDAQLNVLPSVEVEGKFTYTKEGVHPLDDEHRTRCSAKQMLKKHFGLDVERIEDVAAAWVELVNGIAFSDPLAEPIPEAPSVDW